MNPNPSTHGGHHQSPKRSGADKALEDAYRRQYNGPNRQKTGQLHEAVTPPKALKRKHGYANNLHHHGRDFRNPPQSSKTFGAVVSDSMGAQSQHKTPETTREIEVVDLESDDEGFYDDDLNDGVPLPTEPQPKDQSSTQVAVQRKMSVDTVLSHDHIPSLDMMSLLSAPFNFQGLDKKIQNRIMQFSLVRHPPYTPWYNYCSAEQPEEYVQLPNIDVPLVLVNKDLSARATDIFYGENMFDFVKPEVSLWWLKRIGANASKIRLIRIYFTTGRECAFNTSQEVLWLKLLAWFKRKQRISEALIDFCRWYDLPRKPRQGEDEWPEQTIRERDEIVLLLASYGGLRQADIRRGPWLTRMQAKDLETSMTQGRLVKGE